MAISEKSITASKEWERVSKLYEVHDYQHCLAVLTMDFPELLMEICEVLSRFHFTDGQILELGGNESKIPKSFSEILRPYGWKEQQLTLEYLANDESVRQDTHKIDYVKGSVAFDLEWNSKDQTFDRDLFAFGEFFACRKISAAILVTRSCDLNEYFSSLGTFEDKNGKEREIKSKYGASTTHMGKLLPRLDAGRNNGCPVLAIGITQNQRRELK